jgi:4'-phosphopantetheinyl transferase
MRCRCIDHREGLSKSDVHLWTARLTYHQSAITDLLQILDQGERMRAAQFSFERDRMRFIQTHAIVRQVLAFYCDLDAEALTFLSNRQGKPYLTRLAHGRDLQFSVSHSGDYFVLALRLDQVIGIDIEQTRDLPQAIDIAKRYFTPEESRALAQLEAADQRDAFFAWWTHKEAVVKALGLSLADNLRRVEFALDSTQHLRLKAWDRDRSVAENWFTRRFDPAPGYVAAVAGVHPIRSLSFRTWQSAPNSADFT